MKNYFLVIFFFSASYLVGQTFCKEILDGAITASNDELYDIALDKLKKTEICDKENALIQGRQKLQNEIFAGLQNQRALAERKKELAVTAKNKATEAKIAAEQSLQTAVEANEKVFNWLQKYIKEYIIHLQYDDALAEMNTARVLQNVNKNPIFPHYLEVAFWYNESGQTKRTMGILDTLTTLMDQKNIWTDLDALPSRMELQAVMKQLDSVHFQFLMERYYPKMIDITGGVFVMGCDSVLYKKAYNDGDTCPDGETRQEVTVPDFSIAETETTWWQYRLFCEATRHHYWPPPWGFQGNTPVMYVSWYDAAMYSNWVSQQSGMDTVYVLQNKRDGKESYCYDVTARDAVKGYRLPTEDKWEFAAVGGSDSLSYLYSGGDDLDQMGWHKGNVETGTKPVKMKKANGYGLYDMSGNVSEWCWDLYYKDSESTSDTLRVARGGNWFTPAQACRVSYRHKHIPDGLEGNYGFRSAYW